MATKSKKTQPNAAQSASAKQGTEHEQAPANFEDAVHRLGEIVEQLETGELPLEESLHLFEEGVRLARASQAQLDAAEKRVEQLLTFDEEGNPVVREIDPE